MKTFNLLKYGFIDMYGFNFQEKRMFFFFSLKQDYNRISDKNEPSWQNVLLTSGINIELWFFYFDSFVDM